MKNFFSIIFALTLSLTFYSTAYGRLNQTFRDNERQFGKEIYSKQYLESRVRFSGKKIYQLPLFGWQVDTFFRDGRSISETARPKGKKVKKNMLSEQEANVIADMLFLKNDRGSYKKQIKNAHFISHFFEHGVISYEMQLDERKKNHIGIIGVRAILYSDGVTFKDIKVNAYH